MVSSVLESGFSRSLVARPRAGRGDNPVYFLYLDVPYVPGARSWEGGLAVAGPYYPDTTRWAEVAHLYTDLRVMEERDVRGPGHILAVLRTPLLPASDPASDTVLVWIPRDAAINTTIVA
jgi:hypothetical protein